MNKAREEREKKTFQKLGVYRLLRDSLGQSMRAHKRANWRWIKKEQAASELQDSRENGKKTGEKKKRPPVSTRPDSLSLSPYMAVLRVCVCDTGSVPVLLSEGAIRSAGARWLHSN